MSHTTINVEVAAVMYSVAGSWNRRLLLKSMNKIGIEAIIEIRVMKRITEKIIKEVARNPKYLSPFSNDWDGFERDLETIKMSGGKIHKTSITYIILQVITYK
jgi:hypothetical protein